MCTVTNIGAAVGVILLPTEQHARRYPITTRHFGKVGTRLPRLLNDAAFVRLAERPPMSIARRRNDEGRLPARR
jgi:hypothetical protein